MEQSFPTATHTRILEAQSLAMRLAEHCVSQQVDQPILLLALDMLPVHLSAFVAELPLEPSSPE